MIRDRASTGNSATFAGSAASASRLTAQRSSIAAPVEAADQAVIGHPASQHATSGEYDLPGLRLRHATEDERLVRGQDHPRIGLRGELPFERGGLPLVAAQSRTPRREPATRFEPRREALFCLFRFFRGLRTSPPRPWRASRSPSRHPPGLRNKRSKRNNPAHRANHLSMGRPPVGSVSRRTLRHSSSEVSAAVIFELGTWRPEWSEMSVQVIPSGLRRSASRIPSAIRSPMASPKMR